MVIVKYKLDGGSADIASFRKQDFVGTLSLPFDLKKISWEVSNAAFKNAIELVETSQDCFKLRLICGAFKLEQPQIEFSVSIFYKKKLNRRIDIRLCYPKSDAAFIVIPQFNDIIWGRNVNCGLLRIKPSPNNKGANWWQYNNIKNLYIKKSKSIYINGFKGVKFQGFDCYEIPLSLVQEKKIDITFLGEDKSPVHPDKVNVEYYLDKWESATFGVTPLPQDLKVSIIRQKRLVNSIGANEIFELLVTPSNPDAPSLQGVSVLCSEPELISVKLKSNNNAEKIIFAVVLNSDKITTYPINISADLTISCKNCKDKHEKISIVSKSPTTEKQIQFCPESIFGLQQSGNAFYPEEINNGIKIEFINNTNLNVANFSLAIIGNTEFQFCGNQKKIVSRLSMKPKGTLTKEVCAPECKGKKLDGQIELKIDGSDYSQIFNVNVELKKKQLNKPSVEILNIFTEDYYSNAVLFDCRVTNIIGIHDTILSVADLDVSKLLCSKEFEICPNSSNSIVRPGDSITFSIRLRKDIEPNEVVAFSLQYDNHNIYSKNIKFWRPENERDGGFKKSIIFPGSNELVSIGYISIVDGDAPSTSKDCIIIRLPKCLKKFRLEPESLCFNDGDVEITDFVGRYEINLNPKLLWPQPIANIEEPIRLPVSIIESFGDKETPFSREILISPIPNEPIVECRYKDMSFTDANPDPKSKGIYSFVEDIHYTSSELSRVGHSNAFVKIEIANIQSITVPNRSAEIVARIHCQRYANKDVKDLFSLDKTDFKIPNSDKVQLSLIIHFDKLAELQKQVPTENSIFAIALIIKHIGGHEFLFQFSGRIHESVQGDWYALDLGTTGIVIAKRQDDGDIIPVPINDATDADSKQLENDSTIISSIMGVHSKTVSNESNKEKEYEILLEKNQDDIEFSEFILPPAKFIVGQSKIPFASEFEHGWESLYAFNSDTPKEITPKTLISELYRSILERLNANNIRRLTLTYPNTYTSEQVLEIKELVSNSLNELCGRVNAVPESDAVVAHYLNLRRSNPLNSRRLKGDENILIYDMGAGTLDISFVEYRMDKVTKKAVATISKKIGIPIAGNYLNLVLFEALKPDLVLDTDVWSPKRRKTTLETLKASGALSSDQVLNYAFKQNQSGEANQKKGSDIVSDPAMVLYLEYCCDKVFKILFGTESWQDCVDTIVFSGRASRFTPLRDRIKKLLGPKGKDIIDEETISDDELKKCVAIGAIQYTNAYSSENDKNRIQIVSHNQYYRIYAIYMDHDEWNNSEVKCVSLIDPSSYNWDVVEVRDAIKSAEFYGEATISLDPEGRYVQIVQSLLSQKQLETLYKNLWFSRRPKAIIEDDCFVNEVVSIPISELGENLEDIKISVEIDVNNNLDLRINDSRYSGEKIRESIENNRYYVVNETLKKLK